MASFSDFRVPPMSASEDTKAGWFRETVELGEQWQKSRLAWPSIRESLDMLKSASRDMLPGGQSTVRIPRAKRQIRELVSVLANLRPTASNESENTAYYDQAAMYNKLDMDWWHNSFPDRKYKDSFQAAAGTGTAYIEHYWDTDLRGIGRGGIGTVIWDAREVFLINPPKDFDLQKCYAVITRERVPLHILQARFPLRAHELVPEYGVRAYTQQGLDYVQSFMSSPLRALAGKFNDDVPAPDDIFPCTDVYIAYIFDLSINMTGQEIEMGEPGTSWHYTVPSYGQSIPTKLNGWEGLPTYRKATRDDCRIYPLRRKMIATSTKILYDNTSQWWHGKVPMARFTFDDWYDEALGFPLARDVASMEDDGNDIARGISDMSKVCLDPPVAYDENLVSERAALKLNPRAAGQRIKANLQFGEPIKNLLPPGYQNIPPYVFEFMKYLADTQGWIIGAQDVLAITKAKQLPGEGTIDKIMQMAGPLAQDMAREMERPMGELGEMRRWFNCQFRTKKEVLHLLGDNGLKTKNEDFDPVSLVPSHLEGEDPIQPSRYTQIERAREVCGQLSYYVVPGSMARMMSNYQKQMVILLMKQTGFRIDPWTLAEMWEIPNFGPPPDGGDTILQRVMLWDLEMAKHQAMIAQMTGGAVPPGGGEKRGRPNGQGGTPRMKRKDDGSRVTLANG